MVPGGTFHCITLIGYDIGALLCKRWKTPLSVYLNNVYHSLILVWFFPFLIDWFVPIIKSYFCLFDFFFSSSWSDFHLGCHCVVLETVFHRLFPLRLLFTDDVTNKAFQTTIFSWISEHQCRKFLIGTIHFRQQWSLRENKGVRKY